MPKLLPYLQLLRLPTVFTAMADIALGYLLTHESLQPLTTFVPLLIASACLYLAGMVFNDVFDRDVDAVERPNRPIPSGRISLRAAVILGCTLVALGWIAAFLAGGQALKVAGLLTASVLLYDGGLKRTPLGPVAMGSCRFLNVMLGASDYAYWFQLWARPQLVAAAGLGLYIVGVTWFARTESRESRRLPLFGGLMTANFGVIVLLGLVLTWRSRGNTSPGLVMAMLAMTALIVNRRAAEALFQPVPQKVQVTVKTMLLSYVILAATLVFFQTNDPLYAAATAGLVIPAMLLSRWIPMT